jgi:excisionase family DNA binding protein
VRARPNSLHKRGKSVVSVAGDGTKQDLTAAAPRSNDGEGRDAAPGGPPDALDRLLTVEELAELLRCSVSTLNKWRVSGFGPRFVYVGSRVRYRRSDVAAFVADATRTSTSELAMPP